MKKIPKFWKIYLFTVTAVVLLFCVFLVFLGGYLKSYENRAQEEAASKRAAQSLRLSEAKEAEERQSGAELSKRNKLVLAVKEAADFASVYISDAVDSSPERVMDAMLASLCENGISAVSEYIKCDIGKYEDPSSVNKYIDGISGTYSYETLSLLEYTLIKGEFNAKVTLSEGQNNEKGHKTYSVSSVYVSLPLLSYKVSVPEGASLTVNGKTVDEEPKTEQQSFSDVIPSSFSVPSVSSYEFDGLIRRPVCKAYIGDTECTSLEFEDKTVFLNPSDKNYESELFGRICELSFAYSDYVAGAFDFGTMKQYLYSGTKLYSNLSSFDTRWYYEFDHIVNESAKITQFTVLADNLVSAHIEFDQSLRNSGDHEINSVRIALNVYVGCDKVPTGEDKSAWLLISAGS